MSNTIAQRSIATNEAISPTKTPLANAVSQHRKSLLATALMLPVAAMAQGPQLEEVVVTAKSAPRTCRTPRFQCRCLATSA